MLGISKFPKGKPGGADGALVVAGNSFSLANIATTSQSGNPWAIANVAVTAVAILVIPRFWPKVSPLRVNSCGVFVTGVVVLTTSHFGPQSIVVAGVCLLFGMGNWRASGKDKLGRTNSEVVADPDIKGLQKVIKHPATYYSFAYVGTALLASRVLEGHSGGGYVVGSMVVDMTMTAVSFSGLMTNRFKNPAAPYMAVTVGSFCGALSAALSGNLLGVVNKMSSGIGEFALAWRENAAYERSLIGDGVSENLAPVQDQESKVDLSFRLISDGLIYPVRALRAAALQKGLVTNLQPQGAA